MSNPILSTLDATYNETFGTIYVYGGENVICMTDSFIEVEHTKQRAIKIRSSDVETTIDSKGIEQLVLNTIDQGTKTYKIVSWQYHGNLREEIIMIIEGDHRGR